MVALAGATGSGKSSTFNALTGLDLAAVGVRRPTTSYATACVWGDDPATELLSGWRSRRDTGLSATRCSTANVPTRLSTDLVLLDLPDHDSTEVGHHLDSVEELPPGRGLLPARLVHDEVQPSCTSARGAAGLRALHPLQDPEYAQGALALMWRLQRALAEIAGMPRVAAAGAGSHGELAGLLLTRAYHEDRGEQRHEGAHARHGARHQPGHGRDGRLQGGEAQHRRATAGSTSPTCAKARRRRGLPDAHQPEHARAVRARIIEEIARLVHAAGARCTTTARTSTRSWASPARATWASTSCTSTCTRRSRSRTAAAARARARSPCSRPDRAVPAGPQWSRGRRRRASRSTSTGPSRSARCAASRQLRRLGARLAYIRSLGAEGLSEVSEMAVLNANYLQALLAEAGIAEYLPIAFDRTCMHEFVLSGAAPRTQLGVQDARHRQAPARPRLPRADGVLPADRATRR